MPRHASNFGHLGSISALLLSIAVLVCVAVVFVGCTSSSSPPGLYFMKVGRCISFAHDARLQLIKGQFKRFSKPR